MLTTMLTILTSLTPFVTALGGGGIAWYIRGALEDPKPTKKISSPISSSEGQLIKEGWEAIERISGEIHALYHPADCKCAMCEIRADDDTYTPPAEALCKDPCFGCTVLTCGTHPDHKPPSSMVLPAPAWGYQCSRSGGCEPLPKKTKKGPALVDGMARIVDIPDNNQTHRQQAIAIHNLEDQLRSIVAAYQKVQTENKLLKDGHNLISTGQHINGVPLYTIGDQRRTILNERKP